MTVDKQREYIESPSMWVVYAVMCANPDPGVANDFVTYALQLGDRTSLAALHLFVEAPGLTESLLVRLAQTDDLQVHALLASRPGLPRSVQEILLHTDEMVRERLATNASTTPEVQRLLARDASTGVRMSLVFSKSLTLDAALILMEDSEPRIVEIVRRGEWVKTVTWDVPTVCVRDRVDEVAELVAAAGGDSEAVRGLLPNWSGSLRDLLEASLLVH